MGEGGGGRVGWSRGEGDKGGGVYGGGGLVESCRGGKRRGRRGEGRWGGGEEGEPLALTFSPDVAVIVFQLSVRLRPPTPTPPNSPTVPAVKEHPDTMLWGPSGTDLELQNPGPEFRSRQSGGLVGGGGGGGRYAQTWCVQPAIRCIHSPLSQWRHCGG